MPFSMRVKASSPPADAPTPATRNAGPSGAATAAPSLERCRVAFFDLGLALAVAFALSVRFALCFLTRFFAISLARSRRAWPLRSGRNVDPLSGDRYARG